MYTPMYVLWHLVLHTHAHTHAHTHTHTLTNASLVQVVIKFLRKSSVLKDCWVVDEEMGKVPREIQLLAHLSHPNIVQVSS